MKDRLNRLQAISDLLLDVKLAELRAAAQEREKSLANLRSLDAESTSDLDPVQAAKTALAYQSWADRQRRDINLGLASQTVAWQRAQDTARNAFGKAEALRLLRARSIRPRLPD